MALSESNDHGNQTERGGWGEEKKGVGIYFTAREINSYGARGRERIGRDLAPSRGTIKIYI